MEQNLDSLIRKFTLTTTIPDVKNRLKNESGEIRDKINKFYIEYQKAFDRCLDEDPDVAREALMIHYAIYLSINADHNNRSIKKTVEKHATAMLEFIKSNEKELIAEHFISGKLK